MKGKREGGILLDKVKATLLTLYRMIMWMTSTVSSPMMRAPTTTPPPQSPQQGLAALIALANEDTTHGGAHIFHSYMLKPSPKPSLLSPSSSPSPLSSLSPASASSSSFDALFSHSSSWSTTLGDLLGSENGVYTISDDYEEELSMKTKPYKEQREKRRNQKRKPSKELATVKTSRWAAQTPCALIKTYVDGRLVLREEKMEWFEYFEARKENGRLTLNLVAVTNNITECHHEGDDQRDENVDELEKKSFLNVENHEGNKRHLSVLVEADDTDDRVANTNEVENNVDIDGGGGGRNIREQNDAVDQTVQTETMAALASSSLEL